MSHKLMHILICDDNVAIHETIATYLRAEGATYVSVYDGEEALRMAKIGTFDLIILDIMMPKLFGTEVCKEIRKFSDVPILMLTAKGEEIDRIIGLEIGADDYVVKPFSPREVVTRIKTILKRSGLKEQVGEKKVEKKLIFPNLIIDLDKYEVFVYSEKIDFTPKEIEIFYFLAKNPGRVFSREQILSEIWGYDYFGDTRAVDTQIKRLRKKLPEKKLNFKIKSIYGVGYKFEVTQ